MKNTEIYQIEDFEYGMIQETLKEVAESLIEKGYEPIDQLVGYLMSGDPGYISSHKEARNKIKKLDRAKILEYLLSKNYDQS